MTRITVRPDALRSTAARLSQSSREFDTLSQRTGAALSALDWEVQIRADVQGNASTALTGLRRLADQIDQLARYLGKKADAFDDADRQGVAGVGSVSQSWFQKIHDLAQSVYGWFHGLVSGDAGRLFALGALAGTAPQSLPLYMGFSWLRQEFGRYFALAPGGAAPAAPAGAGAGQAKPQQPAQAAVQPATAGVPARTETELCERLAALDKKYPGAKMEQWTSLIWKVAKDKGIPPELLAAIIMQESKGKANAVAGGDPNAGHGLMQIEFSQHKTNPNVQGATDAERRAWLLKPENNVNFGADLLKKELERRIPAYGEREGTKRAVQYYNYGTGAADWVEKHSHSNDDWQATVQKASDTKLGKVDHGGSYGDAKYNLKVMNYYDQLVAGGAPQSPAGITYDGTTPAPGTTNMHGGVPVNPPLHSDPGERSRSSYDNVINQFAVSNNPRYVPRDENKDGNVDTYCNVFVWDVTRAMGAEIPFHVSQVDGHSPVAVGTGRYMNANRMTEWLVDHGTQYGWREVTAQEAQAGANAGHPAVVAWDSQSEKKAGHVAVVRPGEYSEKEGPVIAQAGSHNLNLVRVAKTFVNKTPRYFVHD